MLEKKNGKRKETIPSFPIVFLNKNIENECKHALRRPCKIIKTKHLKQRKAITSLKVVLLKKSLYFFCLKKHLKRKEAIPVFPILFL